MPARVERFGREWGAIQEEYRKPRGRGRVAANKFNKLETRVTQYNTSLAAFLPEWQTETNTLLEDFVEQTEVRLALDHPAAIGRTSKGWVLLPPRVILRLHYRAHEPGDPVTFLNEARLTACAICLWLAALLRSRPLFLGADQTYPRLLVLDDVLLSLDLDHRRPLIDILKKHFATWQVLLLTHNRAWYDIARQRLPDRDWQQTELYAVTIGSYESPVVVEDEDHLYRALRYLEPNVSAGEPLDVKAAAVHVRTKFELILKAACERLAVKVPFQRDPKRLTLNALWGSLAAHKETLQGSPTIGTKNDGSKYVQPGKRNHRLVVLEDLAERISFSLSWVLNPLSHSESVERYRAEIFDAIFALDELERVTTAAALHRLLEIENSRQRLINVLRSHGEVVDALQTAPTASPSPAKAK